MTQNPQFLFHSTISGFASAPLHAYLTQKFDEIVDSHYSQWVYGGEKTITVLDYQDKSKKAMPIFDYEWAWVLAQEDASKEEVKAIECQVKAMLDFVEPELIALLYVRGYPSKEEGCLVTLAPIAPFRYHFPSEKLDEKPAKLAKPRSQPEKLLEEDLRLWLIASGVEVESQVSTQRHRLDLWIPGQMMLELKAGKATADDVCQALDYYSHYQRPVLLVGSGLTNSASRGLGAITNLIGDNAVMFVTWGAVKPYLSSVLDLG